MAKTRPARRIPAARLARVRVAARNARVAANGGTQTIRTGAGSARARLAAFRNAPRARANANRLANIAAGGGSNRKPGGRG